MKFTEYHITRKEIIDLISKKYDLKGEYLAKLSAVGLRLRKIEK